MLNVGISLNVCCILSHKAYVFHKYVVSGTVIEKNGQIHFLQIHLTANTSET